MPHFVKLSSGRKLEVHSGHPQAEFEPYRPTGNFSGTSFPPATSVLPKSPAHSSRRQERQKPKS